MKNGKVLSAILVLALAGGGIGYYLNQNGPTEKSTPEEKTAEEEAPRDDAPLYLTTMTHMEGGHTDDKNENVFLLHVEQIGYAMDLADEYGAILTFESEKPFARANEIWDYNIMEEIVERGHGVGTHCDIGANEKNLSVEEFTEMFKENKELVDALVGAENNLGCSGGGSKTDWVLAASAAGFKYIDGLVGFHYLAMTESNRPEGWTDQHIRSEAYHYQAPYGDDLIYPVLLKDAQDFEEDSEGVILASGGSLGRLDAMEEGGWEDVGCLKTDSCEMTLSDVDTLVEQLMEIDATRDRSKIAKVDIYFPANQWEETNEEVLRYFFSEMQRLEEEGVVQWASQIEVYEAYMEWNGSDVSYEEPEVIEIEDEDEIYTLVSMNVHDWVFPEQSIETLNRVIDIHEEYNVPVGIYLTDPMVQLYVEEAPDLIERLKTSEVVDISYHSRPPSPIYDGFDTIGLSEMDEEELYETLLEYEEHRLDLETGVPTDEPGGYEYLKEVIGYAPLAVGLTSNKIFGEVLSKIYEEKGALFTVVHGKASDLGSTLHGLYKRPEHLEIKLYEYARETQNGGDVIEDQIDQLPDSGTLFIGIKYHENNFYTTDTPWWPIFWEDSEKTTPKEPPYDLNASEGVVDFKSKTLQEDHWELYESTIAFLAENRDTYHPIGLFEAAEMLGEEGDTR